MVYFQQWNFYGERGDDMDHGQLLEGVCEMGYRLLGCGAEIYRVEDTIRRLCAAYDVYAEVFAIPNCLIVSITTPDGRHLTKMRQAKINSTNIQALEAYNALSRRLCADPPEDPREIQRQLSKATRSLQPYSFYVQIMGFFIGAAFFAMFFSGGLLEALVGGLAGLISGGCALLLGRTRSNFFINTVVSAFVLAFVAYGLRLLGVPVNIESVMTGAIMVLVPGLVFTNFMSDLLTGDIVAGLSTFARAVLTAGAIALGTGAAVTLFRELIHIPVGVVPPMVHSPWLAIVLAFVACYGFCLPFEIHNTIGILLCCLGGSLGWGVYLLVQAWGSSIYVATLAASVVVSIYSEIMARLRKCPTTSYLVVSYFPLVPGFTIYRAMDYGIRGDIQMFLETFIKTFGIGGCIALGTLVVSTFLRMTRARKERRL